jgi:methionine-S-sulfoxide reductase
MQPLFDQLEGVISAKVGYTGGSVENPVYEQVITGQTGHAEAIEIVFDPKRLSYSKLLDIFWRNIDPTTQNQQFADRGTQYRTVIFFHNEEQRLQAEKSKEALVQSGRFEQPIVTTIVPAEPFYPAEKYHQFYYKKNPSRYELYKYGSGRVDYLKKKWRGKKED